MQAWSSSDYLLETRLPSGSWITSRKLDHLKTLSFYIIIRNRSAIYFDCNNFCRSDIWIAFWVNCRNNSLKNSCIVLILQLFVTVRISPYCRFQFCVENGSKFEITIILFMAEIDLEVIAFNICPNWCVA